MQKVRIFRPAKNAMQSGRGNAKQWLVEFEPAAKEIDPLMGWVGSRDTRNQLRLRFATKDEAIAYAEREGLDFSVYDELARRPLRPKSYAENFRFDKVL
ncbi:MAG: ETC complex I subunit [Alphaproteobacteria bacterium]|nr:ETC complex I subunit [Alphaproteobacteria bacterium]